MSMISGKKIGFNSNLSYRSFQLGGRGVQWRGEVYQMAQVMGSHQLH